MFWVSEHAQLSVPMATGTPRSTNSRTGAMPLLLFMLEAGHSTTLVPVAAELVDLVLAEPDRVCQADMGANAAGGLHEVDQGAAIVLVLPARGSAIALFS